MPITRELWTVKIMTTHSRILAEFKSIGIPCYIRTVVARCFCFSFYSMLYNVYVFNYFK